MSELTITDRALLRIVQRLGYTTTAAVALEHEPRRGFAIGEDMARRRLRELAQRGLVRGQRASKYEGGRVWTLTDTGRLLADAPPTEAELSESARFQYADLVAAGAPRELALTLCLTPDAELVPSSGRRARLGHGRPRTSTERTA